jgi:hypothetical protein
MKSYIVDALFMIRDAVLSKKFIGVIAASYFLNDGLLEGSEWMTIMLVYLGVNVAEKGIDAFKKPI